PVDKRQMGFRRPCKLVETGIFTKLMFSLGISEEMDFCSSLPRRRESSVFAFKGLKSLDARLRGHDSIVQAEPCLDTGICIEIGDFYTYPCQRAKKTGFMVHVRMTDDAGEPANCTLALRSQFGDDELH